MIAATALDITKEKEEEKRFSQENMYLNSFLII